MGQPTAQCNPVTEADPCHYVAHLSHRHPRALSAVLQCLCNRCAEEPPVLLRFKPHASTPFPPQHVPHHKPSTTAQNCLKAKPTTPSSFPANDHQCRLPFGPVVAAMSFARGPHRLPTTSSATTTTSPAPITNPPRPRSAAVDNTRR
jgi:hypothetical protein